MNFNAANARWVHKRTPPPQTWIYDEDFERNRKQSLAQIDAILWAQRSSNIPTSEKSRTISVWQLETIMMIPEINDFYNYFFTEDNEVIQDEDLKRFINYFWKLVNDIDKLFIFCIIVIDYYEHKVNDLLIKANQDIKLDYLKAVWKINYLNIFRENLQILRQNLDSFYDFKSWNSEENKYFTSLIMKWQVKWAYDYANWRIKAEYDNYKEVSRVFYWQDVYIDPETLSKYQIWTKQKRKIEKEFPPILYN